MSKENTTIIDGAGKSADIKGRIEQINRETKSPPPTTIARSSKSASRSSPAVSR